METDFVDSDPYLGRRKAITTKFSLNPSKPVPDVRVDDSRDALLTEFGKATLKDRYLTGNETPQDRFANSVRYYADDAGHAQRMYEYVSQLWCIGATPITSNGGTTKGNLISCFTAGTPIMTVSGCKYIQDIVVGDEVITHKSRPRKVLATRKQTSDDLYRVVISGRTTALNVTGNHLLLTNRGWKRVDELDPTRDLVATTSELNIEESNHRVEFDRPTGPWSSMRSEILDFDVDEDAAWALGFWFAEGSVSDIGTVKVTHGTSEMCQRWVDIMSEKTGLRGTVRQNKNWFDGEINSKTFVSWFDSEFGRGCKTKTLTDWIVKLPLAQLHSFYEGVYAGDGFKTTPDRQIHLVNPPLVAGLSNILMRLGVEHTLQLYKTLNNGGKCGAIYHRRVDSPGRTMQYKFQDGLTYSKILFLFKIEGEQEVFDIEVEEDHSFSAAGVIAHNCFLNNVNDSLQDIVSRWVENIWLGAKGGGLGTYYGKVRGNGEKAGSGKTSGAISFMKVNDALTSCISQAGNRRASGAIYMDISHPEIEAFIDMRRESGGDPNRKCLNTHHGVCIPDAFYEAVMVDGPWNLVSPHTGEVIETLRARALFEKLVSTRLDKGEPYIVNIDTVNAAIPEHHKRSNLLVTTSNLCSEITLPVGTDHHGRDRTAVCCLFQLNLEKWDEWKDNRQFIEDCLRFVDNVLQDFIDNAGEEFVNARYSAKMERSVGIGVMGFHGFLQQKGIAFESAMAKAMNLTMFSHIKKHLDEADVILAEERGACPDAAEHGFMKRFSNKSAIAPTASVSIIAGSSPGIDITPANIYVQKTLDGTFIVKNKYLEKVLDKYGMNTKAIWDSMLDMGGSCQHLEFLTDHEKDCFKTSFEVDPRWVLEHAADRTPLIDQAQSLNLFIPPDIDKYDLLQIHLLAWKKKIKTLYYMRSFSKKRADSSTGAVREMRAFRATENTDYETCLACE